MLQKAGAPGIGPDSLSDSRCYRLLLLCVRVAWGSCVVAVVAMLPALVFRSAELVTVFKLGLLACVAASVGAVALFLPLAARMRRYGLPEPRSLGRRADTLVACLLADLLDAE